MIAPFIEMTRYQKGSIVEATAMKRSSIKILLSGDIVMFVPVNYKSFKNCQTRLKNGEISETMISNISDNL